jgi:hypothetical protein
MILIDRRLPIGCMTLRLYTLRLLVSKDEWLFVFFSTKDTKPVLSIAEGITKKNKKLPVLRSVFSIIEDAYCCIFVNSMFQFSRE